MTHNVVVNITYRSYITLLANVEVTLNRYKEILLQQGIKLSHPSVAQPLLHSQEMKLTPLFEQEVKEFQTIANFYNCLLLVNYHLGSLLQLDKIFSFDDIQTVSITLEDILVIQSFKDL